MYSKVDKRSRLALRKSLRTDSEGAGPTPAHAFLTRLEQVLQPFMVRCACARPLFLIHIHAPVSRRLLCADLVVVVLSPVSAPAKSCTLVTTGAAARGHTRTPSARPPPPPPQRTAKIPTPPSNAL
jgi:hypothetical protein